ncbi:hypothetical protein GCM10020331_002710 [Ectobacillus funiculus]
MINYLSKSYFQGGGLNREHSTNNRIVSNFLIYAIPFLAGMAGLPSMANLVAAVSNAGGLGTLGAAYMTPKELRKSNS